ncbi:MAG: polymer-forming cytoskeletal protein [Dehalococcoidia bacterium]|nr:polymer-forming cytoskeletal protein [Dehalococcoidia bacterium]
MKKAGLVVLLALFQLLVVPIVSADGGEDNRVVFGKSVVIEREDNVDDLVVFGGNVKVLGIIKGDLVVFGGEASVSGEIRGDMVVFGGSVNLDSTASVRGDLVTFGGSLRKDPEATVGGSVVKGLGIGKLVVPPSPVFGLRPEINLFWEFVSGLFKGIFATLALLALAVLAVAMFSTQLAVTEDVLENSFWHNAGIGALTLTAAACLSFILLISLIGIPVALLLWLLVFLSSIYALVAVANVVGERVVHSARVSLSGPLVNVLVGMVLMMLVVVPMNAISGGCLGTILLLLLATPGIGATVLSRFGTFRWRPGELRAKW